MNSLDVSTSGILPCFISCDFNKLLVRSIICELAWKKIEFNGQKDNNCEAQENKSDI